MIAYLCHPVDQVQNHRNEQFDQTVRRVVDLTLASGVVSVYRPTHAFNTAKLVTTGIQRVNRAALDACDMLLAVWFNGQHSVGVPLELQQASVARIPALLVHDGWATHSWVLQELNLRLTTPDRLEDSLVETIEKAKMYQMRWDH